MAMAASAGLRGAGAEEDEAPEGPLPSLRGGEAAQLSAYERKRLRNISENARFFASLKLFEVGAVGEAPSPARAGAGGAPAALRQGP